MGDKRSFREMSSATSPEGSHAGEEDDDDRNDDDGNDDDEEEDEEVYVPPNPQIDREMLALVAEAEPMEAEGERMKEELRALSAKIEEAVEAADENLVKELRERHDAVGKDCERLNLEMEHKFLPRANRLIERRDAWIRANSAPLPPFKQPDSVSRISTSEGKFNFVETEAMRKGLVMMKRLLSKCPTIYSTFALQIPLLVGPTGMGKTRTAAEIALRAGQSFIPPGRRHLVLYFSFSDFPSSWKRSDQDQQPIAGLTLLANVLVSALDHSEVRPGWESVTWARVEARAKKDLGEKAVIILLVDEVQVEPELNIRLRNACQLLMTSCTPVDLLVLPIEIGLTGIPNARPSEIMVTEIQVRTLRGAECEALESRFCATLGISSEAYFHESNRSRHLRRLFAMCGGLPHAVVELFHKADRRFGEALRASGGFLSEEDAETIFKGLLTTMRVVYLARRCHYCFTDRSPQSSHAELTTLSSYRITQSIVRRLLLDAICDCEVMAWDCVLRDPPVIEAASEAEKKACSRTYLEISKSGLVEVCCREGDEPLLGRFRVTIPAIVALAMDLEVEASIPLPTELFIKSDPRIGSLALYVRLLNRYESTGNSASFNIRSVLRPGSTWIGREVEIVVREKEKEKEETKTKKKVEFVPWDSNYIKEDVGSSGEESTDAAAAVVGDGFAYFPEDKVAVISHTSPHGGEMSIEGMRTGLELREDFTVVYDVFSDEAIDANEISKRLKKNERVMGGTLRGEGIRTALGSVLAQVWGVTLV